jgi:methyl-accepting chemotaxis protein
MNTLSLKKKLYKYYFLTALSAIFLVLEVKYDFFYGSLHSQIEEIKMNSGTELMPSQVDEFVKVLQKKIDLTFILLLFMVGMVMIMFLKNIINPLQGFIDKTNKIQNGDLSVTLNEEGNDEIAQLGKTINGLTSNMQEIIYLVSHVAETISTNLAGSSFDTNDSLITKNNSLHEPLSELRRIKEYYTLYQVEIK